MLLNHHLIFIKNFFQITIGALQVLVRNITDKDKLNVAIMRYKKVTDSMPKL